MAILPCGGAGNDLSIVFSACFVECSTHRKLFFLQLGAVYPLPQGLYVYHYFNT